MLKAKTLIKTCEMTPSQWEGVTENNKSFYIRYRWGKLVLHISKNESTNVNDAISGDILFEKYIGSEYDGIIDIHEIRKILKNIIDLSIDEDLNEISF